MSFNNYDPVSPCQDTYNNLCASGRCASNDDEHFYCINPTSTEMPKICSLNSDCVSAVDPQLNVTVNSICSCSYGSKGYAYCGLFPGDSEWQQYLKYLEKWYEYPEINRCNTLRRTAINCLEEYTSEDFYVKYTYYMTQVQYYPLLQDNDKCVKQIYTSYYWTLLDQLNDQDDDSYAASLGLSVALGVLLS
jgi:hypothetical protein